MGEYRGERILHLEARMKREAPLEHWFAANGWQAFDFQREVWNAYPAVRLSACGEKPLRLPCFWFGARYGVLPAFGAFTGNAEVLPRRGDQVFVIAEEEVLQVG
jgi:hypothetical protein